VATHYHPHQGSVRDTRYRDDPYRKKKKDRPWGEFSDPAPPLSSPLPPTPAKPMIHRTRYLHVFTRYLFITIVFRMYLLDVFTEKKQSEIRKLSFEKIGV
jgi:hypothetical protein